MKKLFKLLITLAILAGLGYGAYYMYLNYMPEKTQTVFSDAKVTRGDIYKTISATGTVEPEELINVGAQVNGKIMKFGVDSQGKTIDFGSKVTEGMVLALIDDVTYKAEMQQAQANKEQALASITSAKAQIIEAKANAVLAEQNYQRAKILIAQLSMTQSDFDSYEAAYHAANAKIKIAEAALEQANASLSIAQAALIKTTRNLEYCTITSPVNGIVIDRRVSIGQTVVSNQTASSIFLVATDFSKMQLWVSVNEADIGSVWPEMDVMFSCDAFPNERFTGKIHRIRLNATLSSNVVTYIVEVDVDNSTGKLVPYLTANVKFVCDSRHEVLMLPNSALRFIPPQIYCDVPAPKVNADEAVLWIENDFGKLSPRVVKTGLSNGINTEIISDDIQEGLNIIVGVEEQVLSQNDEETDADALKNPFLPNMPKHPGRGSAAARERSAQRQGTSTK